MQTLLVLAWQQRGGEELTSWEETVRHTHKERQQTVLSMSTQERTHCYSGCWVLPYIQHEKVSSKIGTPLSNSIRQRDNVLLFTTTTTQKCNAAFWADQMAQSRMEQHIQTEGNRSAQQWHNRKLFLKGRIKMREVSRPNLHHPERC